MMKKKSRKLLSMGLCLAMLGIFTGGLQASAADTATASNTDNSTAVTEAPIYNLAEVVVNGRRYIAGEYVRATSNVGVLGEQDIMSLPLSVTTISEKATEDFMSSTEGMSKMLSLVPSVQKTYDASVDCVNIRGFSDDGRGFSINGIPGMQAMTRQSVNYIDSIDVIEGPTSGITGTGNHANYGGTININSKKAEETPIRNLNLKYHSDRAFEQNIDIGQRFGKDNKYGVRVNVGHVDGERSIHDWDLKQYDVYVNMDQRSSDSNTNFLFGYTKTDNQGRPYGLSVSSSFKGDHLPSAPDGDINFNPKWRRDKNTNLVMTLNHEQTINDHMKAFLNAGHFKQDWYYYVGFSKTLLNENGDFKASSDNYSLLEKRDYAQIGIKGDFHTGSVKHDYTLSVDRQWHYYGGPSDYKEESGWTGNIYSGADSSWQAPSFSQADAYYGTKTRLSGWSVTDMIKSKDEKLTILLGYNGKTIKKDSYNPDGSHKANAGHYHGTSPTYAINYMLSPRFSVFASHDEQFVEGRLVTGSQYANKGATLDPFKAKQNEFGVKFKTGDFFHKLSYFDIKKANYMDVEHSDGTLTQESDGQERHKGIEYTATGSIAKKWNLIGGFMHIDASQVTSSSASNGKRPNGLPEWTANLGVEYEANNQFSTLLRGNYVGSSYVLNEKYKVPSYFTLDIGFKYKTEFNHTPVKFSAMCYNVFDKHYWSASGNTIHSGGPRTFMVSMDVSF